MIHGRRFISSLTSMALWAITTQWALAQDGRPDPAEPPAPEPPVAEESPEAAPVDDATDATETPAAPAEEAIVWTANGRPDRRAVKDEPVILSFKDVTLEELIEFIALETGKIVMPIELTTGPAAGREKYNIVADQPLPRSEALDFIFTYLRLNEIGIIEQKDVIFIGKLEDMLEELGEIEVVGADQSVLERADRGTLILKIFQVEHNDAGNIKDDLSEIFPEGWGAKFKENDLSNQMLVLADVALCQQMERIITDLDRNWIRPAVETFRLRYADATEISDNILDLFEQSGTSTTGRTTGNNAQRGRSGNTSQRSNSGGATASQGRTEAELRLTVNAQQNSVTVTGEEGTVEEIGQLIRTQWDLPRPEGTSRLFMLKYTDPIKVRDLLLAVIGGGSTSNNSGQRRGGNQQRSDASDSIAGVYQFEAFPDRNALLVLAKTEESFTFIESVIEEIDRPTDAGLPEVIPLRYADAVELAEEINVLLSSGGQAQLPRPETGLTAEGFASSSSDSGLGLSGPSSSQASQVITFPWNNSAQDQTKSPESALIGKVRVVPVIRQNALAILAPEAYKEQMRKLIEAFDRPRRQVLLSATVVEVDLGDALNLGVLFGTKGSLAGIADGPRLGTGATFGGGGGVTDPLSFLFSDLLTSTATSGLVTVGPFDLELIIQAMNVITNTRIIQEPRVFTADNEEAVFFSGKEFPVATGTSSTDLGSGGTTTTIEYKNVGVFLNVRPRITEEGAVDLAVSLELSDNINSVSVGNTQSEVFSRKQVTSHVIVLDGQTLVIGGLLKESEQVTRHRVPLLADIPIIGPLFQYNDERLDRSELIAFITPTVVHRPVDNFDNFNLQDIARLESVARPLAEQIQADQKMIDLDVYERVKRTGTRNVTEILPDRDPAQDEIDSFTPLLIEHDPSEETEPVKQP